MSDKEFVDAVIKMYDDYVDDAFYTEEEFDRIVRAYIIYYNL